MKPILALGAAALIALAACSEQDMCLYRASADVKAAERQISTLQGNISRGYAIHKTQERVTYTGVCYRKNGKPYECPKTEWQQVERPVPIDVRDQRRQLRELQLRLPAMKRAATAAAQQCRVQYPE